ncbi:MAG: N-acetylmuramoyl-L-alanine amidase [Bacteroidales bacterium]|nr:N-acetylmuramoyl-L-alanine amidase [Bacteroidales bacterium]
MKRFFIIFGMLVLLALLPAEVYADRLGYVRTVVIDPGHGGHEPGAVGRKVKEKDLTLAISLKVGEYIKENLPDVKVIYTRDTDKHVELRDRTRIANENQADLFISIHCNSVTNRSAYGTETFVMGPHRNQANLEVAKLENASILYEDNYLEAYDGYDPNSPESNIIFTLFQNAYLNQSLTIASLVQDQFRERARRVDRGVKQAGFLVLYRATMPAILVETGFISNAREEEYLASEEGQNHIASAIYRAFRDYKTSQDQLAAAHEQQMLASANTQSQLSQPATPNPPARQSQQNTQPANNIHSNSDIVFKVQFASTSTLMPPDSPEFMGLQNVEFYFHDGLYKYTVGNETSLESAAALQERVQRAGLRDAFVVAFQNNDRISPAEAVRLINQRTIKP